jgi:hypothetical protein
MVGFMKKLARLLKPLAKDGRVGPVHLCVYLALVMCMGPGMGSGRWVIRREEVMRLAKIKGRTTYYRVMKDLVKWGYIEYRPGDGRRESEVGALTF